MLLTESHYGGSNPSLTANYPVGGIGRHAGFRHQSERVKSSSLLWGTKGYIYVKKKKFYEVQKIVWQR